MSTRPPWLPMLLLVGCAEKDRCDEGFIRDGERCTRYVPSDPVVADTVQLAPGVTWQWQITGRIDTSHVVEVYNVDGFDLSPEVLAELEANGRVVVCYFSAGSFEPWRDDAARFPAHAIGKPLDGWPDERWLDTTDPTVREIMLDRLDHMVQAGCIAVEPDNVTAHRNRTGFGLNATEQLDYNRFLADSAHERGLSIALKNDTEQIRDLVEWFDFAVNEECSFYDECGTYGPFRDADKAVLNAEYVDDWADAAALAEDVCGRPGLSTIIKTWDLGPERFACTKD